MNGEIICVGTELLLGDILNTNAQYLSRELAALGINVYSQAVVGDNMQRLKKQLSISLARSELIILTGGLGPTNDDLTKEAVAEVLGLKLVMHEESLNRITQYFNRLGRPMTESNKKQALCPEGADIMPNDIGTAPGYIIRTSSQIVMLFPGPPSELKPMFERYAIPYLKKLTGTTILSHTLSIFGIGEAKIAEVAGELLNGSNPTVATYAKTGETQIRVTARAKDKVEAEFLVKPVIERLKQLFGDNIYGINAENLQSVVVKKLIEQGKKIATAESCTAGMLSSRITEVPGSSAVFDMGVTAYSNYIKIQALGVKEDSINRFGAVSPQVAAEMAVAIRTLCGCDLGVGITGVAGPGASENKPAGLVYIAVADSKQVFVRKIMCGPNNREKTRITATSTALDMVRRYLDGSKEFMSFGTPIGSPLRVMEQYTLPAENIQNEPKAANLAFGIPKKSEAGLSNDELFDLIYTNLENEKSGENQEPGVLEIDSSDMDFVVEDESDDLTDNQLDEGENQPVAPKKNKGFKGFLQGIFPWKGDPALEVVRKIVFLTSLIAVIGLLVYIVGYFGTGYLENKALDEVRSIWNDPNSNQKNDQGIFIGFEELLKRNSDIKGWLTVPGTNIDNPVYQTTDNEYYNNHNMNKKESRYGALYIDKRATIGKESNSQNVVIYGHHMRDGSMFGTLKRYLKLDFYKQNPVINFKTLYRDGQYKVFAVFIINTREEHDNNYVFNYRIPEFSDQASFLSFIDNVKQRSIIDTGVDVIEGDEIITLSTCTYEFDDARLVVMARRVREGESPTVDTSLSKLNPNPLYPQIWYDKKGIKKTATTSSKASDSSRASNTSSAVHTFSAVTTSSTATSSQAQNSSSRPASGTSSTRPATSSNSPGGSTSSGGNSTSTPSQAPPTSSVPGTSSQEQNPDTSLPEPSSEETPPSEE